MGGPLRGKKNSYLRSDRAVLLLQTAPPRCSRRRPARPAQEPCAGDLPGETYLYFEFSPHTNIALLCRAYKLGKQRWSYNEVNLVLYSAPGEVLVVRQVAAGAGVHADGFTEGSLHAVAVSPVQSPVNLKCVKKPLSLGVCCAWQLQHHSPICQLRAC